MALGVSWPGRSVTCGPVSVAVAEGMGRYIDCLLDAAVSLVAAVEPQHRAGREGSAADQQADDDTHAHERHQSGGDRVAFVLGQRGGPSWPVVSRGSTWPFSGRIPGRPKPRHAERGGFWSDGGVQNPLAKQRALLSLRAQAAHWLAEYEAELVARGLGFTPEDVAAVEASAKANPTPKEKPGPGTFLSGVWVAIKATVQSYPSELRADDPRLAPVAGLTLPAYAVAAKAIFWATDDAALVARVTAALGFTPADWEAAIAGWTDRIKDDVVIATMYGQLFAQVTKLPMKASP